MNGSLLVGLDLVYPSTTMRSNEKQIATGVVHAVPGDVQEALTTSSAILEAWNDLTPLARNEWICWITSVKKPETRKQHIERLCTDLIKGKRRPCCWPGCPHREKTGNKSR